MNAELENLVAEYNQVEAEQEARLRSIYAVAAAQPGGGHEIVFSNGEKWGSNTLAIGRTLARDALENLFNKITRLIVRAV